MNEEQHGLVMVSVMMIVVVAIAELVAVVMLVEFVVVVVMVVVIVLVIVVTLNLATRMETIVVILVVAVFNATGGTGDVTLGEPDGGMRASFCTYPRNREYLMVMVIVMVIVR